VIDHNISTCRPPVVESRDQPSAAGGFAFMTVSYPPPNPAAVPQTRLGKHREIVATRRLEFGDPLATLLN
jgi:hypothetical protein